MEETKEIRSAELQTIEPYVYKRNYASRRLSPKKNTGRKYSVFQDEFNLKNSGGCYCIMPYDNVDDKNKCIFKIGMTLDFISRIDKYHTYYPEGVYTVAFLINPPLIKWSKEKENLYKSNQKNRKRNVSLHNAIKKKTYRTIEKYIIKMIDDLPDSSRIYSTTRVQDSNKNKKGATEWVYTNCSTIHNIFTIAQKKFGGEVVHYYLTGIDTIKGNQIKSIHENYITKKALSNSYTGIILHTID